MESAATSRKIPRQERSRQSEQKLLEAAENVLSERGAGDFSLLEVAARAGVTTGTIYSRFKGKGELIRAVHERVMDRMEANAVRLLAGGGTVDGSARRTSGVESGTTRQVTGDPQSLITDVIIRLATVLEAEGAALRALMFHAVEDKSIARLGAEAHARLEQLFDGALQRLQPAVPELSASHRYWAFTFSYDVLARHLGLGHSSARTELDNWDDMLGNLAAMIAAYLLASKA